MLYVMLPLEMSQKQQFMQNAAARMLVGSKKYEHAIPSLKGVTLAVRKFLFPIQHAGLDL